ncbi:hypothetical protein GCM10022389_16660 [Flavobacterium cheonanense]|uniref:Uncharacterized protein n=1 Tax=Flavobacterium cheonanense TaxID=706183 RepID=A0ABP7VPZ9_9FLAO
MKKYLFILITILSCVKSYSQDINKEYIKIKKETYLKTDYKLEVGELYMTDDDYPYEILETYFGKRENSYKIKINDELFWVSEAWCKHLSDEEVSLMQSNWKKKIEIEKQKEIKEKEEEEKLIAEDERIKKQIEDEIALENSKRLALLKKKYGKRGQDIYDGYFWVGMSRNALIDSLGQPDSINKSVGKWGVHEQFVYGSKLYIYIENKVVTSYQQNK